MGMFDYVKYEAPCPNCGKVIDEWQSKDYHCTLGSIEPWRVDQFYTSCPACGVWIECEVEAEVEHIVKKIEIKMTHRKSLSQQIGGK